MIRQACKLMTMGLVFASTLMFGGCNGARSDAVQDLNHGATGFMVKELPSSGRQYGLFVPPAYAPQRKWPVIIFLHGIGEAGSDPRSCMKVGLGPAVSDQQATFPFIVIFAQSTGGWDENSGAARDVIATLDQVERDYSVDESCVTLTGLSTGGYGTWAIGAKYKDRFSALVPMAAYTDHKDAGQLTDEPIWCFHNTMDPFVLAAGSHSMVDDINGRGGQAKYSEFFAPGHDCWSKVYAEGELFAWMQAQHKVGGVARRNTSPVPTAYQSTAAPAPTAPRTVVAKAPARPARAAAPAYVEPPVPSSSTYAPPAPAAAIPVPARSNNPPAMLTPY